MKKCAVVYEPQGKAREYAELAVNLYTGCNHGCTYCYAPLALHKPRSEFYGNSTPRKNILENLEKDARILEDEGCDKYILMCFTCDPYQSVAIESGVTRKAIEILINHNLKFEILTKAGMWSGADFDLMKEYADRCRYGATISFTNAFLRSHFEPNAAPIDERMKALKLAYFHGIQTWVSIEPVINPDEAIRVIDQTHGFVDEFKIGKINHVAELDKGIDWAAFARAAKEACDAYGTPCYLKKSLWEYL